MNEDVNREQDEEDHDAGTVPSRGVVVRAEDLFGDQREIWIDHNGERYRLRITRRGKLILQK